MANILSLFRSFAAAARSGKPDEHAKKRREPSVEPGIVNTDEPSTGEDVGRYKPTDYDIDEDDQLYGTNSPALRSWSSAMVERNWLLVSNVVLAIGLVAVIAFSVTKKPVVIVKPPMLTGDIRIEDGKPNKEWLISWALYAAYQVGNINPRNVSFISRVMTGMLSPQLQINAEATIRQNAEVMKNSNITQSFVADDVRYDQVSGLIWVWGNKVTRLNNQNSSTESASAGDSRRWTYEFIIRMNEMGMPIITHMDQYSGLPDYDRAQSVTPEGTVLENPKEKSGKPSRSNK